MNRSWTWLSKQPTWVIAVAVGLVSMLPFIAALSCGFVYDDLVAVVDNPVVSGDFDLGAIFGSGFWGKSGADNVGSYRPLTVLTFAMDHRIGGGAPWAFHLINLLLHGAFVASLVAVLRPWCSDLKIPVVTAIVFGLHAVHAESIVGIVGRADLLAGIFALWAWHGSQRVTRPWLFCVAPLFAVSLLCKEVGVFVLGVAIAQEVLGIHAPTAGPRSRRLLAIATMLGVLAAYLVLRHSVLGKLSPPVNLQSNPLIDATFGQRLLTAGYIVSRIAGLLVAPLELSPDYSHAEIMPVTSPWDIEVLAGLSLWLIIPALIVFYRARRPLIALGLILFSIAYLPIANVAYLIPTIFAERLLYLPSVGLALVVGSAMAHGLSSPKLGRGTVAILSVLALAHTARATVRTLDWHSQKTLWKAAAKTSPNSAKVWLNLGTTALDDGERDDAQAYFARAAQIAPQYAQAHTYLGITLDMQDRPAEAHREFLTGFNLVPRCAMCAKNLGTFYIKYGKFEAAVQMIARYKVAGGAASTAGFLESQLAHTIERVNAKQSRPAL